MLIKYFLRSLLKGGRGARPETGGESVRKRAG